MDIEKTGKSQTNQASNAFKSIDIETEVNQAIVYHRSGKLQQAEQICQQILDIDPQNAEVLNLFGLIACQAGKYEIAVDLINHALDISSNQPLFLNNLGFVLKEQGKISEAIAAYSQALDMTPESFEIYNNLGVALYKQRKYDKAIEAYQKAIQIQPDYAAAYNNLGIAWQKQGKLEQAVQIYNKTLVIRPNYPQAYNNLANTLKEQGKLQEAVQVYHKAIEINSSYIDAHKNLGIVLLLQGDFQRGWQEYEWRLKPDDLCSGNRARTRWDGSSLSGKTILLYAEQGFGDTIQFIRYVHLLMEYDTKILVECQPELLQLFGNIGAIQKTIAVGQSLPKFDVNASLLSLPSILGTDLSSIPAKIPYLYVKSQSNTDLEMPSEYKVGVVWAGNLKHPDDNNRSVGLQQFSVLFDVVNCQFFSLQVGNRRDDIIRYSYSDEITDLGVNFSDFFDTAVAISELDLVISVDTAVAHLAGALGKPVWVLLPFVPDWRWLLEREDTPWYPTMRLFRQTNTRDWAEVLKKVRLALEKTSIGSKKAYNN